jgi:acyl-CoA reductase-like NAD-dependent aldehyde dehydrogenase
MLECVSAETRARLRRANRNFVRLKAQLEEARRELAEAIVAERREGTLIEDITADVTYRQTHVNRVLEAAGLTEKRPRSPRAES